MISITCFQVTFSALFKRQYFTHVSLQVGLLIWGTFPQSPCTSSLHPSKTWHSSHDDKFVKSYQQHDDGAAQPIAVLLDALFTQGALADTFMAATGIGDFSKRHNLIRLMPSFAAALQAYQIRAAQCGHSFAHTVLLEAAVQGWYVTALIPRLSAS